MRFSRLKLLLLLWVSLCVLAVACGDNGTPARVARPAPAGEPRPFLLGVSSVPQNTTDDSYREAFAFAATAGEVVLIQRAPPWTEFVPGGRISDRTERLTRLERDLARENNLKLFLAIDPTDPADRGRLAALPPNLVGRDFSDGQVRSAFISYAKYLALNYKPAYLALGMEVDMFFNRRGDAAFRNFQSLYFEAYDAVKDVSPSTMVFPTFQFEDMQAVLDLGRPVQPAWTLVGRFEPKLDAVAVTSFPGFAYSSLDRLPQSYYSQLKSRFQKPLILASLGWASGPNAEGLSSEDQQTSYLRRAMAEAEDIGAEVVIWFLGRDIGQSPEPDFSPLATMGLVGGDGRPKAVWLIWRTYLNRPLAPR